MLAGLLLAGCSAGPAGDPAAEMELSSFSSADELLAAVNGLYGCDPGTETEPTAIVFDGHLPQYAMCTDTLQVVRYENEDDRITAADMLSHGQDGPAGMAEGANWHVMAVGAPGDGPSEKDMKDLSYQLGGRYTERTDAG